MNMPEEKPSLLKCIKSPPAQVAFFMFGRDDRI